jgi:transposase-like protein
VIVSYEGDTAMSALSQEIFRNESAAIRHLESTIWPDGVSCPHCGVIDRAGRLEGKKTPIGTWKCYACRKQFTAKVGTVFESSHIPVYKWLQAAYLLASSKKGISAHQLHRTLQVTYKTAWFMEHRLREAMRALKVEPMGGEGKAVEADETFIGNKGKQPKGARGYEHKEKVFSLVERGGRVHSTHVPHVNAETLRPILTEQLKADSRLMTDDARHYRPLGKAFASHESVNHSIGEYVRGDVYTNTIENYFSIFKRGMKGIYQHCSTNHLKRYLAEYDFRYNHREGLGVDDAARTASLLEGIKGKRLTYRVSGETAA